MNSLSRYSTSPLYWKIAAWLTVAGSAFVVFHSIILAFTDLLPADWIQELFFFLFGCLPLFLVLSGNLIRDVKLGIWFRIFLIIFGSGYIINTLNALELLNLSGLQWVLGPSLLALFVIYLIHWFRKKKNYQDVIRLLWLISMSWPFIAKRFVPGGGYAGWFLLASFILFPVLMSTGLFSYFKRSK